MTVDTFLFRAVRFSGRSWCSYFDTTDGYLRFIPADGKMTVPFFSGRNKRCSHLAGYFFRRVEITTGKNYERKKKVQASGRQLETGTNMVTLENTGLFWRKHKTQNTTHTDTTTNKMSRATLPIIFR
jgi:hypothetical protein